MSQPIASPISLHERSDILDILRGFALLGIFLDNIFAFTGYTFATTSMREAISTAPIDQILQFCEFAFIQGKFYSLFSLLFGIGFSVILIKSEQKGINPLKIFFRRLFILLLIGVFHLVLIWEGDILFLYAVLGLFLPLFRKCSDRSLIIWAIVLIASPIFIDMLKVVFQVRTGSLLEKWAMQSDERTGIPLNDTFSSYLFNKGSGWQEWRNWQASGYLYRLAYIVESNRIPKVIGLFVLGYYVGRKLIYIHLRQNINLFKKLQLWGYVIGIPCGLALAYYEMYGKPIPNAEGLFQTVFYTAGVVPLSLAYATTICLWWIKSKDSIILEKLKAPGRMALTNYLTQTFLGIGIFYGVGGGFGGNIGPTTFLPIALLIYLLQVLWSNWWFIYFNYGPIEWIWRQLTYMKRLPIRKL